MQSYEESADRAVEDSMANYNDILENHTPNKKDPEFSKEEYAAKKKAEKEDAFSLSDETAAKVVTAGIIFQEFLDVQATFIRYSTLNALLIFATRPDATQIGNFEYWKDQGYNIKNGEKSFSIFQPHEYSNPDGTVRTGYNVKKMFDISQIYTKDKKEVPAQPSWSGRQLLDALIAKATVKIKAVDQLPGELIASTDLETGDISVRKSLPFAETFRGIAQELALAGLKTEVKLYPRFASYAAAYLLCKKYGVDTQNFNFEDVSNVFNGMDAMMIKGELSEIRRVAENLSWRMSQKLPMQKTQEKTNKAHEER